MTLTLELTDTADAEDRRAILEPLVAFNLTKVPDGHHRPLNVLLRGEEEGNVTGGLWGRTGLGLARDRAAVRARDRARGRGVGAETVEAAEREARARGCHGAWVDTFDWQARGFYQSLGYTRFGELPDFPTGYPRHFLQKRL